MSRSRISVSGIAARRKTCARTIRKLCPLNNSNQLWTLNSLTTRSGRGSKLFWDRTNIRCSRQQAIQGEVVRHRVELFNIVTISRKESALDRRADLFMRRTQRLCEHRLSSSRDHQLEEDRLIHQDSNKGDLVSSL